MVEINNRFTGNIICEGKCSIKKLIENKTDLRGANLREAEIEFYQFPSIRLLSSFKLDNLTDDLTLEIMRWDAYAHPKPKAFDEWAKDGKCPYKNEERWWHFSEKKNLWKSGNPTMRLSDLILEICRQQGWGIRGYLKGP